MVGDLRAEVKRLKSRISDLEAELEKCRAKKAELNSALTLCEGRLKESAMGSSKASGTKSSTDMGSSKASGSKSSSDKGSTAMGSSKASGSKSSSDKGSTDMGSSKASGSKRFTDKSSTDKGSSKASGTMSSSDKSKITPSDKSAATPPPTPPASKPLGIASTTAAAAPAASAPSGGGSKNMYAALKPDNLQVVEGIGPKMNEVLKKHGVHTWAELGSSNFTALRGILDKENPTRYRIIDPKTWPAQAKLAHEGEWDQLIAMQKQLDSGRSGGSDHETDSKVEKMLIKLGVLKRWKQDDLKAVEGIGPKIEGLLKADGIDTWRKLSNANVTTIQEILNKAGKRYKLADPGTWPKQAGMCADGKWDELTAYQDELNGGK